MWFLPWREVVVAVQREGVCVPCAHASRARARSHRDIVQRDHHERDLLALTLTLYAQLYLLVGRDDSKPGELHVYLDLWLWTLTRD